MTALDRTMMAVGWTVTAVDRTMMTVGWRVPVVDCAVTRFHFRQ